MKSRVSREDAPSQEGQALESSEIARLAVDAATDKKAVNVVMLNVRELTVIADYFVICTGMNLRQIAAIAEAVDEELGKVGVDVHHREGSADTGWVLYDFGDVILHVFGPMEREFYQLENLWSAAPRLLYVE
ncbi:MAG: ribosome silencing factor [Ktedonobacterales bacterium]|nr:ribosome silencing factor [Ktedonobacterales bacterium]